MDRHTLGQLGAKVGELLRFGSRSCIHQAHSIMIDNFENVLSFALELSEPKPQPKHTIADNYPAGGLTATEPCMFCKRFHEIEEKYELLCQNSIKFQCDKCHEWLTVTVQEIIGSDIKLEQALKEAGEQE